MPFQGILSISSAMFIVAQHVYKCYNIFRGNNMTFLYSQDLSNEKK